MNIISDAQIKILAQSEAEEPSSYFYSPQIHKDSSGHYYVLYMLGGGASTNDIWIAKSTTTDPLGDWTHHQLLDPDGGDENTGGLVFVIDSDDNIHTICAVYDVDAATRHYRHRVYDTDFTLLSSDTAFSIVFDDDRFIYSSSISDIRYDKINDIIHFIYRASSTASSETEGWKHRSYDFTSWSAAHELEETLSMSVTYPISLAVYGDHVVVFKASLSDSHKVESFDSGATWTDTLLFDGEDYYCDNAVTDSNGNIYACFEYEYGVYYMSYSASETAWSAVEQVIPPFDDYQSFFITVDKTDTPYITVYISSETEGFTEYRVYKKEEGIWTYKTGSISGDTEEDWWWIDRPGTSYYADQYQCLSLINGSDVFGIVYSPAVSYEIHNVQELQLMRDDAFGNYTIANDIDASETSIWRGGKGWEYFDFNGSLNGLNHIVSSLYINEGEDDYGWMFYDLNYEEVGATIQNVVIKYSHFEGKRASLFDSIVAGGTVKNVIIIDSEFIGHNDSTNIFANSVFGLIEECFSIECSIQSASYAAVFTDTLEEEGKIYRCGSINNNIIADLTRDASSIADSIYDNGEVSQCFAYKDTVNGRYSVGLVSSNYKTILDCFSRSVLLSATDTECGISLSSNDEESLIENVYFAGIMSALLRYGVTKESAPDGLVESSYWDKETSDTMDSDGGEPKSTSEMKSQATFVDWDFDTIWFISEHYNDGYPFFQWFKDNLESGRYTDIDGVVRSFNTTGLISEALYFAHIPRDPVDGSGSTAVPVYISGIQLLDILD